MQKLLKSVNNWQSYRHVQREPKTILCSFYCSVFRFLQRLTQIILRKYAIQKLLIRLPHLHIYAAALPLGKINF